MENPFLVSSVPSVSSVFSSFRAPTSRYVQDFEANSNRSALLELDGPAGVVRPQALARGGGIIGWWRCSDD